MSISISTNVAIIILSFIISCVGWWLFSNIIIPKIIKYGMKEKDRNPKWITSQLQYYGFNNVDIVLCESKWGNLPYFRFGKNKKLELWVDYDTSVRDIEEIGRLALASKIKAKYNLSFFNKPIYWLSILCYLLDGGDIQMSNISWEESHKNKKPLD